MPDLWDYYQVCTFKASASAIHYGKARAAQRQGARRRQRHHLLATHKVVRPAGDPGRQGLGQGRHATSSSTASSRPVCCTRSARPGMWRSTRAIDFRPSPRSSRSPCTDAVVLARLDRHSRTIDSKRGRGEPQGSPRPLDLRARLLSVALGGVAVIALQLGDLTRTKVMVLNSVQTPSARTRHHVREAVGAQGVERDPRERAPASPAECCRRSRPV